MAWKKEGRLFVPNPNVPDEVETHTNENGESSTESGIVLPNGVMVDKPAPKIPRETRRLFAKLENRAKKKEAKRATREMLRNRWLPLVKPKEGHASGEIKETS